jgi:hypothetical protein
MLGHEFVHVPAKPRLDAGPLADQVFAVIDKQFDPALLTIETSGREVGFPERCSGDGHCVDRIGLAGLAGTASKVGHQLGWNPDHSLAGSEKVTLKPSGDLAAVLERPPAIRPLADPSDGFEVTVRGRPDRLLGDLAAELVNCDEGVGALV